MRLRISFTILWAIVLIGGCIFRVEDEERNRQFVNVQSTPPATSYNGPNPEPFIEFEQTRGECPSCAVYVISIYSNGRVIYQGRENVKRVGVKEFTISQSSVSKLEQIFISKKFLLLSDQYVEGDLCPKRWTDGPTYRLFFRQGMTSKTVLYYSGCEGSEELDRLAAVEKAITYLLALNELTGQDG